MHEARLCCNMRLASLNMLFPWRYMTGTCKVEHRDGTRFHVAALLGQEHVNSSANAETEVSVVGSAHRLAVLAKLRQPAHRFRAAITCTNSRENGLVACDKRNMT
jgi:hypothetical protein